MVEWTKDSYEYKFMADFYLFCKEFYVVENKPEYYEKVVKAAHELCNKYENKEFVVQLVLGFISYVKKEYDSMAYGVDKGANKDFYSMLNEIVKGNKKKG